MINLLLFVVVFSSWACVAGFLLSRRSTPEIPGMAEMREAVGAAKNALFAEEKSFHRLLGSIRSLDDIMERAVESLRAEFQARKIELQDSQGEPFFETLNLERHSSSSVQAAHFRSFQANSVGKWQILLQAKYLDTSLIRVYVPWEHYNARVNPLPISDRLVHFHGHMSLRETHLLIPDADILKTEDLSLRHSHLTMSGSPVLVKAGDQWRLHQHVFDASIWTSDLIMGVVADSWEAYFVSGSSRRAKHTPKLRARFFHSKGERSKHRKVNGASLV